ncbi:MAG: PEP-CTERM sorting domain-containing protein [Verrucomicrobiota bacterium]
MNTLKLISTGLLLGAISSAVSHADTVYIDHNFDSETIGEAPAYDSLFRTALTTIEAGTGAIGTDNAARFNDSSSTLGGILEYNAGAQALGSLYMQFDLLNNDPAGASTSGSLFVSVGNWNPSTGNLLNSSTKRSFTIEFSADTNALRLRGDNGAIVFSSTYTTSALQTVKIFANDNDSATLDYINPGTGLISTLNANSVVVFINDALVADEEASGFGMSVTGTSGANTTGDATLGRIGFNSTSTNLADFLIDNVYVSSIPSAIPEPSAFAALLGLGALGFTAARRRRV